MGFGTEAGFPLCYRFISEEKFRDLPSPNGYIYRGSEKECKRYSHKKSKINYVDSGIYF
jgi:hypothetical protein